MGKRAKLCVVMVWLMVWVPAAVADASFRLERADGSQPRNGLSLAAWVNGAKTVRTYYEAPKPRVKVVQAVYRAPAKQAIGKCYTEPGTPPASVLRRESGGNPRVWNGGREYKLPGHSTASGCWQFIRSTWCGSKDPDCTYEGYRNAADAPVDVQNKRAKELWAGGKGYCHWHRC